VAASHLATAAGDPSRARLYMATADDYQGNVKQWTVTTNGPYGDGRYFIRLSVHGDPNAPDTYDLGNGSIPAVDQRTVIDAGFLELTRMGELPADDSDVQNSLGIVDSVLENQTASGPGWHRYGIKSIGATDGYGDCYVPDPTNCMPTGAPWFGTFAGSGHLWPILDGERSEQDLQTGDAADASSLELTMQRMSWGLGMVPEQAWEDPDYPASPYGSDPTTASIGFQNGKAAGSAAPLIWGQAQYLRGLRDLQTGKVEHSAFALRRQPAAGDAPDHDLGARQRVHRERRDDPGEWRDQPRRHGRRRRRPARIAVQLDHRGLDDRRAGRKLPGHGPDRLRPECDHRGVDQRRRRDGLGPGDGDPGLASSRDAPVRRANGTADHRPGHPTNWSPPSCRSANTTIGEPERSSSRDAHPDTMCRPIAHTDTNPNLGITLSDTAHPASVTSRAGTATLPALTRHHADRTSQASPPPARPSIAPRPRCPRPTNRHPRMGCGTTPPSVCTARMLRARMSRGMSPWPMTLRLSVNIRWAVGCGRYLRAACPRSIVCLSGVRLRRSLAITATRRASRSPRSRAGSDVRRRPSRRICTTRPGEKARAVKARYVGVCCGCGAYTQPRNGKGDACAHCKRCHPGAIERRWTRELVLSAMLEWRERYGWLPSSYDWSRTQARKRGGSALRRLEDGRWPSASVINVSFGTWAAARHAAEACVAADWAT
jgi:hypothetical protein